MCKIPRVPSLEGWISQRGPPLLFETYWSQCEASWDQIRKNGGGAGTGATPRTFSGGLQRQGASPQNYDDPSGLRMLQERIAMRTHILTVYPGSSLIPRGQARAGHPPVMDHSAWGGRGRGAGRTNRREWS